MSKPSRSIGTEDDRAERKERYHAVLRTVGLNTTEMQSPGAPETEIVVILAAHGRYSSDGVRTSLQAAVENDDLLRWTGPEGYTRYTLVTAEDLKRLFYYAVDELKPPVSSLRSLVGSIAEETDHSQEMLGEVNAAVRDYAREDA